MGLLRQNLCPKDHILYFIIFYKRFPLCKFGINLEKKEKKSSFELLCVFWAPEACFLHIVKQYKQGIV